VILIDDRKGSVELEPLIASPKQLTRLEYGDIAFIGNGPSGLVSVGIERKTVPDLINSMHSGRLSGHQLIGLQRCYTYIFLLVEGIWRQGPDGLIQVLKGSSWMDLNFKGQQTTSHALNNYLNTLSIICNVKVWQTSNIRQSARWISNLYNWFQKDWEKHHAHLTFYNPANPPSSVMLFTPSLIHRIVKELPGVGWEKGKLLADKYETLPALMQATVEDLEQIPGIGPKIASRIVAALRGTKSEG